MPNPGGPVSQSTIPEHLKSFLTATRNSTRTAPDVVLIGESRDPDTLRGMMESAEIGVAAYSTVHTRSVPETLSRIINVFPFAERLQVTATLLSCLRLVISQRLLPLPDNSGRTALREYLGGKVDVLECGTGLHLLVRVRDGRSQDELVAAAAAADVAVYPTKKYWANPARAAEGVVLVGFSSIAEADIRPGIAALARAWFG